MEFCLLGCLRSFDQIDLTAQGVNILFQKLMWIDNNPVFCKESGTMDIENEPYLAGCFFFCCRRCNVEYYSCVLTRRAVQCLELAYRCADGCVKDSSPQIVVQGW